MSTADDKVELRVNGKIFDSWTSIRISTAIDQIAGEFELGIVSTKNADTGKFDGNKESVAKAVKDIFRGDECSVFVGGELVITGYVYTKEISYSADSHSVTISGRDKAGDLVDCSIIHKTGDFKGKKLEQIANELCKPFGVTVKADVDTGKAVTEAVQEGETVFDLLDRAAHAAGVMFISDNKGGLIITRAGKIKGAGDLIEGKNIVDCNARFDDSDRHSEYIAFGQSQGSDTHHGKAAAHPKSSITDPAIKRYRPLMIQADEQGFTYDLKKKAEWERNVRRGKSSVATITVNGFKANKKLWRINTLTHFNSPMVEDTDADLLITSVTYSLDDRGTITSIDICHPESYEMITGESNTEIDSDGKKHKKGATTEKRKHRKPRKKKEKKPPMFDGEAI